MYFESDSDAINFTANISAGLIEVLSSPLSLFHPCPSRSKVPLKDSLNLLPSLISTLPYIVLTLFLNLQVQMR
jgi:hypothetical protein